MEENEHHIKFSYQARYNTYGDLTEDTKTIWYVIHGYGQLAKYFIRKFYTLNPKENFIIAPEGLNRFYLQGFEGRVGANWMTKEDRLTDIENYISLLNEISHNVLNVKNKPTVNILGFSQGAATVCRWLANGNINYDRLILWAGIFPPDLEIETARKSLQNKKISLVIGEQDEFLTPERIKEMEEISRKLNVQPEVIKFNGGHTIDVATLQKIAAG